MGSRDTLLLEAPPAVLAPDWSAALCAQADPDAWHPEGQGASSRDAQRICRRCPIIRECGAWALATDQPHGVWGGMTARHRRRLLHGR